MAMSKTLLRLAFLFSVTLLIVSAVSARHLATNPLSTQKHQSVKLSVDAAPIGYPTKPYPYKPIGYPAYKPPNRR